MNSASLDLYLTLDRDSDDGRVKVELRRAFTSAPLASGTSDVALGAWRHAAEYAMLADYIERPLPEGTLAALGNKLGSVLLPGDVAAAVFAQVRLLPDKSAPVHLYLDVRDDALADWPWEYARLATSRGPQLPAGFLGRHARFRMIRFVAPVQRPPETARIDSRLKVLIAWANPTDHPHSNLTEIEAEKASVRNSLSHHAWKIECEERPYVSASELSKAIRTYRPHVLHLICHGDDESGSRFLMDQGGRGSWLPGEQLAEWLAGAGTRLTVLSACSSAGAARAIAKRGISAVISMQLPVRDSQSKVFFGCLYDRLSNPTSPEYALTLSDALVYATETLDRGEPQPDWALPVLYLTGTSIPLFEVVRPRQELHIPEREAYCVGRDQDLDWIHRAMFPVDPAGALLAPRVAIAGTGGMGKTTLAHNYVLRSRYAFPDGVYWINADRPETLRADYARIGSRTMAKTQSAPGIEEQVAEFRGFLQNCERPALLILDNIRPESAELLHEDLIPVMGSCRVLVTTRNSASLNDNFQVRELGSLDEDSALAALGRFRGRIASGDSRKVALSAAEDRAARAIVRRMGAWPMAIRLVARTVGLDSSFQDYLARNHAEEAVRGELAANLATSLDSLGPTAAQLFSVISLFSAQGIPRDLIQQAYIKIFDESVTEDELKKAERLLCGQYLLGYEGEFTGEPLKTLAMHEVVRDIAFDRIELGLRARMVSTVARLLTDRLNVANVKMRWQASQGDIAHAYSAAERCRAYLDEIDRAVLVDLIIALGEYEFETSQFKSAVSLFAEAQVLAEADSRHPFSPVLSRIERLSAQALQRRYDIGDPDREALGERAREGAFRALEMAQKAYTPGDEALARYYDLCGYVLKMQYSLDQALADESLNVRMQENLVRAEALYMKSLEICSAAAEHTPPTDIKRSYVATCLNYVGVLREEIGRLTRDRSCLQDARRMLEEALDIDRSVRGGLHFKIAIRRNNLGRVLGWLGEHEAALRHHRRAAAIYRMAHGDVNKDVADSLIYGAVAYKALGKFEQAERYVKEALRQYREIYGSDHPIIEEKRQRYETQSSVF